MKEIAGRDIAKPVHVYQVYTVCSSYNIEEYVIMKYILYLNGVLVLGGGGGTPYAVVITLKNI